MSGPQSARRVIHLTSWLSRRGGGIPPVIWALARSLDDLGIPGVVSGLEDAFFAEDSKQHSGSRKSLTIISGRVKGPAAFGWSPDLASRLAGELGKGDLVHVHGLWMHPGILGRSLSRRMGCRRVVSPHGMLEPWALRQGSLKKRLAGRLFENKNLQSADCLHALCDAEKLSLREYGLKAPIAVIPNGIDLPSSLVRDEARRVWNEHPHLVGARILLFLSRIHPKKGVPDLLRAWAHAGPRAGDWRLVVVGPDECGHEAELRRMAADLSLTDQVVFAGPAYGDRKSAMLAGADAFVLPSHSEGFSMAVLEAAASGLPVLLTRECHFSELARAGGAVEVPAGVDGIGQGLDKLLAMGPAELAAMGAAGRNLVRKDYTWQAVAVKMKGVYDWLTHGGPPPPWVELA